VEIDLAPFHSASSRGSLRSNASSDRVALKGLLIELLKSYRLVYMSIYHLVHFANDAQVGALSFVGIFLKRFSAQIDPWPSDGFNETHGNIKFVFGDLQDPQDGVDCSTVGADDDDPTAGR
jgi:hypothetical protein